jgi:hypothetical protein
LKIATMPKKVRQSDGCGHFLATGIVSAFFLAINGVLVSSLYVWLAPRGPALLAHPRTAGVVAILGPLLLVFFEWWIVDWVVDIFTPRNGGMARQKSRAARME